MRVPFVGRDMLESSDCMCMYTCIKGKKEKRKGKKKRNSQGDILMPMPRKLSNDGTGSIQASRGTNVSR